MPPSDTIEERKHEFVISFGIPEVLLIVGLMVAYRYIVGKQYEATQSREVRQGGQEVESDI